MKIKSVQSWHPCAFVIQTIYNIVKAHGGELTLDSNEELGTRFTIKMPIA